MNMIKTAEENKAPNKEVLSFVFWFLDGKTLARACSVSRQWKQLCFDNPIFLDLLNLKLEHTVKAHDDVIENINCYGNYLFVSSESHNIFRISLWIELIV